MRYKNTPHRQSFTPELDHIIIETLIVATGRERFLGICDELANTHKRGAPTLHGKYNGDSVARRWWGLSTGYAPYTPLPGRTARTGAELWAEAYAVQLACDYRKGDSMSIPRLARFLARSEEFVLRLIQAQEGRLHYKGFQIVTKH